MQENDQPPRRRATDKRDETVYRATGGLYRSVGELAANAGVPFVLAIVILFQLVPLVQHGIGIADRVDGELNILAANCSSLRAPSTTVIVPPPNQP